MIATLLRSRYRYGGHYRIGSGIYHANRVSDRAGDVDECPIRRDGYSEWLCSNRYGGNHRIGCRVYHGDGVISKIRYVGEGPIWSDCRCYWEISHRDGCNHRIGRRIYHGNIVATNIRHVSSGLSERRAYSEDHEKQRQRYYSNRRAKKQL